jgi:hypothetical protein
MKLTLAEIRWMQRGLATITQMSLPIRVSYRLSKLLNFCNEELTIVEKSREGLVKKLGTEVPDKPGELQVSPENETKFREEFAQLLLEEVELDFTPIKISEFGEDMKIAPAELASLSKILEED